MLTLKGRMIIPIRIGEYQKARMDRIRGQVDLIYRKGIFYLAVVVEAYQKARMDRIRGQVDLIYRKGIFYLAVVVEAPEPSKYDPIGVIGVDLGIVNLAVDSDGEVHSGVKVDTVRSKTTKIKSKLQKCGSKSAKRHLKKLSGK
jgi:transposase